MNLGDCFRTASDKGPPKYDVYLIDGEIPDDQGPGAIQVLYGPYIDKGPLKDHTVCITQHGAWNPGGFCTFVGNMWELPEWADGKEPMSIEEFKKKICEEKPSASEP